MHGPGGAGACTPEGLAMATERVRLRTSYTGKYRQGVTALGGKFFRLRPQKTMAA
jgi:hypothetical protein